MGRKITMTGRNARYVEHRGVNATPDNDREIRMEGEDAGMQSNDVTDLVNRWVEDVAVLLAASAEGAAALNEEEVIEELRPIFFNNENDARQFLKEIAGMQSNDVTDLVNRWVEDKRISDYGNSRKGALWVILHKAGLYTKSRQNWCRRVY